MSQREVPGLGNEVVRLIDASTGAENYTLPANFAVGRKLTVRRTDSSANTVTISVPSGDSLNGAQGATKVILGGAEIWFQMVDPGRWQSFGDGGGLYAPIATTPPRFTPAEFVVLGDSITADGGRLLNNATYAAATYTNVAWPWWGQILADSRVIWAGSYGLPGINTQMIRDTYLPFLLARPEKPKYAVVAIGKNNDEDTDGYAAFRTAYLSIVTQLRSAGITPILCTVTPPGQNPLKQNAINNFIRNLSYTNSLPLVDNYAAMVDPATGLGRSTHLRDTIHPNPTGAKAMGAKLAEALIKLEPINWVETWLPKSSAGYSSLRGGTDGTGTGSHADPDPLLLGDRTDGLWVAKNWQALTGHYAGCTTFTTPGAPILGRKATATRGSAGDLNLTSIMATGQVQDFDKLLCVMRLSATVEATGSQWSFGFHNPTGNNGFRPANNFPVDLPSRIVAMTVDARGGQYPYRSTLLLSAGEGGTVSWSEAVMINLTGMGL